ncbi:hypothetical protein [Rhizorhapis suberifaciens]|uniref:Uncharacterized protein n=1 Tax=Rhizorhapis suberifaciens TaxID=13656 RepID=A0A840HZ01_9SPHN|nr:hypothetical protein [Rhizorhapis suberifaciens]MBB4642738.1 hypothetical protein [Rhizorhapis suberifaciens]
MIAEESGGAGYSGSLSPGVHQAGEWLSSLIGFIGSTLPEWRDDPARPFETGEDILTTQLCGRLNSLTRHSKGWDILQFRREEPDDGNRSRTLDLVAAPNGTVIWISGREYTEYQFLLPIECKRLPTPSGAKRDEREYLFSQFSSTGGIQRFKVGHHGSKHLRAAMIAYVQDKDVIHWQNQIDSWVDGIVGEPVAGWSPLDKFKLVTHDKAKRVAAFESNHVRQAGLEPIRIDHLWIEM